MEAKEMIAKRGYIKVVRQTLAALKNLHAAVEAWDPVLLGILTRKIDAYSSRSFQLERDQKQEPTIEEFLAYMDKRALALENTDTHPDNAGPGRGQPSSVQSVKSKVALAAAAKTSMECVHCPPTA
ncbi:uncharacterized protein [Choristoneura fumiferana]|uniref:uncharacterized protein n=1 Tax=Choristoneura fumiferana TaxID=7141 RepID=UPI003D155B42